MYSVELYVNVRRAVMVDQCSEREAARLFGIHRKTVKKICQFAVPPAYSTPFGHSFHEHPATYSTMIRPGQSERSDARFSG